MKTIIFICYYSKHCTYAIIRSLFQFEVLFDITINDTTDKRIKRINKPFKQYGNGDSHTPLSRHVLMVNPSLLIGRPVVQEKVILVPLKSIPFSISFETTCDNASSLMETGGHSIFCLDACYFSLCRGKKI